MQRISETNVNWRNRWHCATFTSKSGYVMKYDRPIMRNITPHWHDWISSKLFQCEKKIRRERQKRKSKRSAACIKTTLNCSIVKWNWSFPGQSSDFLSAASCLERQPWAQLPVTLKDGCGSGSWWIYYSPDGLSYITSKYPQLMNRLMTCRLSASSNYGL